MEGTGRARIGVTQVVKLPGPLSCPSHHYYSCSRGVAAFRFSLRMCWIRGTLDLETPAEVLEFRKNQPGNLWDSQPPSRPGKADYLVIAPSPAQWQEIRNFSGETQWPLVTVTWPVSLRLTGCPVTLNEAYWPVATQYARAHASSQRLGLYS